MSDSSESEPNEQFDSTQFRTDDRGAVSRRDLLKGLGGIGVVGGGHAGVTNLSDGLLAAQDDGDFTENELERQPGPYWGTSHTNVITEWLSDNEALDENNNDNLSQVVQLGSAELDLMNVTWQPQGNPDLDGENGHDGAWQYTFQLNVTGIGLGKLKSDGPVVFPNTGPTEGVEDIPENVIENNTGIKEVVTFTDGEQRDETKTLNDVFQMAENFAVKGPKPEDSTNENKDFEDDIAISVRRDRELYGSLNPDKLIGDIAEKKSVAEYLEHDSGIQNQQFVTNETLLKGLKSRQFNTNSTPNEEDVLNQMGLQAKKQYRQELRNAQQQLVTSVIKYYAGKISKVGKFLSYQDITKKAAKWIGKSLAGPPDNVAPAKWRGFRFGRVNLQSGESSGPLVMSYATFDVYVSPGESTYFTVSTAVESERVEGHNSPAYRPLGLTWRVNLTAPEPKDQQGPVAPETYQTIRDNIQLDPEHSVAGWPYYLGLSTDNFQPTDSEYDWAEKDNYENTPPRDPLDVSLAPAPKPVIWTPSKTPEEGESFAIDAYNSKAASAPIYEYQWHVYRLTADGDEKEVPLTTSIGENLEKLRFPDIVDTSADTAPVTGDGLKAGTYKIKLTVRSDIPDDVLEKASQLDSYGNATDANESDVDPSLMPVGERHTTTLLEVGSPLSASLALRDASLTAMDRPTFQLQTSRNVDLSTVEWEITFEEDIATLSGDGSDFIDSEGEDNLPPRAFIDGEQLTSSGTYTATLKLTGNVDGKEYSAVDTLPFYVSENVISSLPEASLTVDREASALDTDDLDKEKLILRNTGTRTLSLENWTLTDGDDTEPFTFPVGEQSLLDSDETVTLYTDEIPDNIDVPEGTFYWGQSDTVWDIPDTVSLTDTAGNRKLIPIEYEQGLTLVEEQSNFTATDPDNEYVRLENTSGGDLDLSGWTISAKSKDASFQFPDGTVLNPANGNAVTLTTGSKPDNVEAPGQQFFWDRPSEYWNDSGTIVVENTDGNQITYEYESDDTGTGVMEPFEAAQFAETIFETASDGAGTLTTEYPYRGEKALALRGSKNGVANKVITSESYSSDEFSWYVKYPRGWDREVGFVVRLENQSADGTVEEYLELQDVKGYDGVSKVQLIENARVDGTPEEEISQIRDERLSKDQWHEITVRFPASTVIEIEINGKTATVESLADWQLHDVHVAFETTGGYWSTDYVVDDFSVAGMTQTRPDAGIIDDFERDQLAYYEGQTDKYRIGDGWSDSGDKALRVDHDHTSDLIYSESGLDRYPRPGDTLAWTIHLEDLEKTYWTSCSHDFRFAYNNDEGTYFAVVHDYEDHGNGGGRNLDLIAYKNGAELARERTVHGNTEPSEGDNISYELDYGTETITVDAYLSGEPLASVTLDLDEQIPTHEGIAFNHGSGDQTTTQTVYIDNLRITSRDGSAR